MIKVGTGKRGGGGLEIQPELDGAGLELPCGAMIGFGKAATSSVRPCLRGKTAGSPSGAAFGAPPPPEYFVSRVSSTP